MPDMPQTNHEDTPLIPSSAGEKLRQVADQVRFSLDKQPSFSTWHNLLEKLTRSERDVALAKEGVGAAAFLIRDAVVGQDVENPAEGNYDPYDPRVAHDEFRNTVSIVCHRLCSYRPLVRLLQSTCWLLVILTFIEPPDWCRPSYQTMEDGSIVESPGCPELLAAEGIPAGDSGSETTVEYYPSSHSMLVTRLQSHRIEAVCLLILYTYVCLRIGRDGMSLTRYLRPGISQMNRVVQLVCLVALTGGLLVGHTIHHAYARMGILLSMNQLGEQRDLRVLFRLVPKVFNVLALLGVLILFYGWFGTVMFLGSEEGLLSFSSLAEAMVSECFCAVRS